MENTPAKETFVQPKVGPFRKKKKIRIFMDITYMQFYSAKTIIVLLRRNYIIVGKTLHVESKVTRFIYCPTSDISVIAL